MGSKLITDTQEKENFVFIAKLFEDISKNEIMEKIGDDPISVSQIFKKTKKE